MENWAQRSGWFRSTSAWVVLCALRQAATAAADWADIAQLHGMGPLPPEASEKVHNVLQAYEDAMKAAGALIRGSSSAERYGEVKAHSSPSLGGRWCGARGETIVEVAADLASLGHEVWGGMHC